MAVWGVLTSQLILICMLAGHGLASFKRVTRGHSGETCREAKRCLYRKASCFKGKCVCLNNMAGEGDFDCYSPSQFAGHHGHVKDDPIITTNDGEKVQLPVTCRYLMAHVKTVFTAWPQSTCEIMVYAFQNKHRGKIFVSGFDLAIKVVASFLDPDSPYGKISFRKYGNASNGIYNYREQGALDFVPNGPWPEEAVYTYLPDTPLRVEHNPYDNNAFVDVPTCGFKVSLRLADIELGKDQILMPGLSVTVNPENNPEYLSKSTAVLQGPGAQRVSEMADGLGLTKRQAMVFKTLTSDVEQNQPYAAQACVEASETLKQCPDKSLRRRAMDKCMFLLDTALVMHCLDNSHNGQPIMSLFERCLHAFCKLREEQCRNLQDIMAPCEAKKTPQITDFRRPETCNMAQSGTQSS